jgi:hypothetical protein
MKTVSRFVAVIAMIVATLFLLVNIASITGLWMLNAPTISMLTGALTVSDELLLKTDKVMERTDKVLVQVIQLGQEIGGTIDSVQQEPAADAQSLEPVQETTMRVNQSMIELESKLKEIRTGAQATEQTITRLIQRVPAYVNLVWISITLVLLWLALAQAAIFYLGLIYLRTGSLGWSKRAQVPASDAETVNVEEQVTPA